MVEVAKWFRGRRAELGMTQAQYAAMLGLPPLLISKLERGTAGVSLPTLLAALEATGGILSVSIKPVDLDMGSPNPEAESYARRRAGRPRTYRTEQIRMRLSKEELAKLRENSKEAALTPVAYVRRIALNKHISHGKLDRDTQTGIWRQISGIARNINQITKTYHLENHVDIQELKDELEKITALFFSQKYKRDFMTQINSHPMHQPENHAPTAYQKPKSSYGCSLR